MMDQPCDATYQTALDAATAELDKLFAEAKRLRNRMEQVDEAMGALKQLLEPSESDDASQSNWRRQQFDTTLGIAAVA